MIRFRTLGTVDLADGDGRELRAILRRPKLLGLLAYLCVARPPGFRRRDTLVAMLWPELDHAHARNALRQAVHSLREALGRDTLVSRGDEELGVHGALISCDALEFESALDAGEAEKALALYRGSLLPGLHLSGVPDFERWLDDEREYKRRRATEAAAVLTDRADAAGNAIGAARWAHRKTELSPSDESAVRRLVELLDRAGDRPGAVRVYEDFRQRLARDLELEPSSRTRALVASIRARRHSGEGDAVPPADVRGEPATAVDVSNAGSTAGISLRNRRLARRLALGGLLVTALSGVIVARPSALPSLDPTLVAVAPFDVLDPKLALWREGLIDVLARSLDGAGPFRTVPPTVVVRHWEGRVDRESAQALAYRTGAGFILYGQLLGAGPDSVRLTAAVLDVRKDGVLSEIDRTDRVDRIDRLIDSVSVDVIRALTPTTAGTRIRLYSVGTKSLPAVKAFVQGEYYFRRFALDSAVASFQRAVAIDTAFTLALHRLYAAFGWGQSADPAAIDYLNRIKAVSHGLSPRDSLLGLGVWTPMRGGAMHDHPEYFSGARRRLMVLEEAAKRYPEDPEVWYQLGELLVHSGFVFGASADRIRNAFERTIALDSGFAPAYIHAIELAHNDNDAEAARGYVRAYLRIPSAHAERAGIRLLSVLLDSPRRPEDIDRALRTASPGALHRVADAVHTWPDAQETQLKVWPRALQAAGVGRSAGGASTHAWASPQASALATLFIFRGHLKEAGELVGDQIGVPFMQLAELGAIPPENVARAFDRWVRQPEADTLVYPSILGATAYHLVSLPCFASMETASWWASRRDTTRLRYLANREDARANDRRVRVRQHALFERASAPVPLYAGKADNVEGDVAVRHGIGDFVRAALTLARGDTVEALNQFLAFPDSLCPDAPRLREIRFRLLAATGRDRDAAAVFDGSTDRWIPLVLARAHLAKRLGDWPAAEKWYRFVADAWRHADPELQPVVTEARAAIAPRGPTR